MIHRVGNRHPWLQWLAQSIVMLMALFSLVQPPRAPQELSMRSAWRNGTTVYEAVPVATAATPLPVTEFTIRRQYASPEFARAARLARVPVRPSTVLPRSAWGNAMWNPVTGEIKYRPFHDPSPWYYIGAVHQSTGSLASFQSAINAVTDTEIVEMTANVALRSTRLLYPTRGDTGWVLVRTSSYASLPAVSQSTFAVAASKPTSTTLNGHPRFLKQYQAASTVTHAVDSRGWHWRGIVYQNDRLTTEGNGLPTGTFHGWNELNQTDYRNGPKYAVFDQCVFDGKGTNNSGYSQSACLSLGGEYAIVRRCRMEALATGAECKCILGSRGLGKYLIVDSTFNGSSMHIIWGGTATNLSAEYCSDIIIRQNYGYRAANELSQTWTSGTKNFYETKNSTRIVWEGNDSWGHDGGGQIYDWTIGAKPQTAAEANWVQTWDCLIRSNRNRESVAPMGVFNTQNPTNGAQNRLGVNRVEYQNNLTVDGRAGLTGTQTIQILAGKTGARTCTNIKMTHNTVCVRKSASITLGTLASGTDTMPGFIFSDNVVFRDASSTAFLGMFVAGGAGVSQYNGPTLDIMCGVGQYAVESNLTNATGTTDLQAWGTALTASGNRCKSSASVSFVDTIGLDYTLAESAYQNMSTTNGRPGVSMAPLTAFLAQITA